MKLRLSVFWKHFKDTQHKNALNYPLTPMTHHPDLNTLEKNDVIFAFASKQIFTIFHEDY